MNGGKNPIPFPGAGLIALTVTGLWGCLLIYASRTLGETSRIFAMRQLLWLLFGCLGFTLGAAIPFRRILAAHKILAAIALAALAAVLVFGDKVNGMRGWFAFSDSVLLQPSEFAKPVLILVLASLCGREDLADAAKFRKVLASALPFLLLILAEPDFGTAVLFLLGTMLMIFLGGLPVRYLLFTGAGAAAGAVLYLFRRPYAWDRIVSFLDPESPLRRGSWHIRQFRYAVAQGGWTGSDQGTALWSSAYLPLPHSDSMYAMIAEMSGAAGGLIVLGAFCAFAFSFALLARKERITPAARLYAAGIAFLYLAQGLIHIGVNVVLIPPTGLTLPFLSYGGSSLCSTMTAFGIAFGALRCRSGPDEQLQNEVMSA